jgi:hypothetical protein
MEYLELEMAISCQGNFSSGKSRVSFVDSDIISNDQKGEIGKFVVRMTMLNRCKNLSPNNRCNLTNESCVFKELLPIERENFEDEDFDDQNY